MLKSQSSLSLANRFYPVSNHLSYCDYFANAFSFVYIFIDLLIFSHIQICLYSIIHFPLFTMQSTTYETSLAYWRGHFDF